jgi:hypothetical protein
VTQSTDMPSPTDRPVGVQEAGERDQRTAIYGAVLIIDRGGIASWTRPSRVLPLAFGVLPPHCLKKKGTLASEHASRRSVTQWESMGR